MIEFRQKEFSEYDAMKYLYNELMRKDSAWRYKIKVINSSSLLPILRGNNIVIERFVISTQFGKKDKYRMYLKIGAKAKMPEAVRLPGYSKTKRLFNASMAFGHRGLFGGGGGFSGGKKDEKTYSTVEEKTFNKKNNGGGGGFNAGGNDYATSLSGMTAEINYDQTKPKGETLLYDPKSRSLVLEFEEIQDAVGALNILPFGLNYDIYLLDV